MARFGDFKIPWKIVYFSSPVAQLVKQSACNAGDWGLIPGLGRSPRKGNGNPLQYSCLENSMDHISYSSWGGKELDMTEQLSLSSIYVKK